MSAITEEMVEAGVEEIRKAKHTCFDRWTDHDAIRAVLEASAADRIAALSAENERLRKALERVAAEAKTANDVIRMNRDGGGNGRVKVATAMHRIAHGATAALEAKT